MLIRSWFDDRRKCLWYKLTTNEINTLPFVLSLSKDLVRDSLSNPVARLMTHKKSGNIVQHTITHRNAGFFGGAAQMRQ